MNEKLAKLIARDIFEIGDMGDRPAKRIQFMIGDYSDEEKASCGLCEEALIRVIKKSLENHI